MERALIDLHDGDIGTNTSFPPIALLLHQRINACKLPRPARVVQKRPQVKPVAAVGRVATLHTPPLPVVVRTVALCMARRRQHRSLVPVDGIVGEKCLDLARHCRRGQHAPPLHQQPQKHRHGPTPSNLTQPTVQRQLLLATHGVRCRSTGDNTCAWQLLKQPTSYVMPMSCSSV